MDSLPTIINPDCKKSDENYANSLIMLSNFTIGNNGSCSVNARLMALCIRYIHNNYSAECLYRFDDSNVADFIKEQYFINDMNVIEIVQEYVRECGKNNRSNQRLRELYYEFATIYFSHNSNILNDVDELHTDDYTLYSIFKTKNSMSTMDDYRMLIDTKLESSNSNYFIIITYGEREIGNQHTVICGKHETCLIRENNKWLLFDDCNECDTGTVIYAMN